MNPAMQGRTKVPAPPARVGLVRGFPMTYEMNEFTPANVSSTVTAAYSKAPGILMRTAMPLTLRPPMLGLEMLDISNMPNAWVRGSGPG